MNIQTTISLRAATQYLVKVLDLLNSIDEKDFAELVAKAKLREKRIKGIKDNAERGNVFMVCFFLRELLEELSREVK